MRSIVCRAGLYFCVLLAVSACSGHEIKPLPQRLVKMGYREGPPIQVVHNYSVEGWHAPDNQHVIVETGTSTDYLVTLDGPCDGLDAAVTIGFSSVTGDLRLSDELIIRQVSSNFKCPLRGINPLYRTR